VTPVEDAEYAKSVAGFAEEVEAALRAQEHEGKRP
jgi:hypothetical protein